ncbi:MAG: hypothetical protein JRH11_22015 [Deltaproteobacteria bacterium]|nr:hypothetical protein [Deltaproteobacteria bacterium]
MIQNRIVTLSAATVTVAGMLLGACGSDETAPPPAVEGQPTAVAAAAPAALAIDGPAQAVQIPAPPSVTFDVADRAEYQVDVTSANSDVQLYLYQGEELVGTNDDGGEGQDAMLIAALTPGAYQVRIHEHDAHATASQVQVRKLAPLATAGVVPVGGSFSVSAPAGDNDRAATAEVNLVIAAAGNYVIDATSDSSLDPKIALMQDLDEIEVDDDGGDGHNSRIERTLEPGTYQLRVWDLRRRAVAVEVSLAAQ